MSAYIRRHRVMKRNRIYPNLRTWREEMGLSQREAAELLATSQPNYCRFERQTRAPKPRAAQFISKKTGVPLESVLGIA